MTYPLERVRKGSGFYENGEAGETLGARKLVYLDTNGVWKLADADAAARFPVVGITLAAINSGKFGGILTKGYVGDGSWTWTDIGAPIYASATAGELTQTEPTMGTPIQIVGLALEGALVLFDTGLNMEVENFFTNENNWDDLRFPASSVRLGGAAPATTQAYKDGIVLAFASTPNQYIYVIAQMPHRWDTGTDIEAHVHWTIPTTGAGTGAENVKWDLTYSWSNIGAAIPNSSALTVTRDVQNITADVHMLNTLGTITGTGKTKSSCLIVSLKRDVAVANDYADAIYLIELDFHFKSNRIGSQTIPSDTPA